MNTRFLNIENGRLAYDDAGAGPLVICAPGMGDVRGEYRFLAPQLAAAGYRVASVDVRGHGETSERWPDYSVGAIGADLLALIQHLDAGPAVIVGTSMAAAAAVWAAAEAPERVAGLVLVGPFVRGVNTWQDRLMSGGLQLLFGALFARPWGPGRWARYYAGLYPTRRPADLDDYCAALRANLAAPGRLEALHAMLRAPKNAAEARLPRVAAPALVVMGTKDPDFKDPAAEAGWVAQQVRGTVRLIPGAGHYPHAEMPEIVGPVVLGFLESLREKEAGAHGA